MAGKRTQTGTPKPYSTKHNVSAVRTAAQITIVNVNGAAQAHCESCESRGRKYEVETGKVTTRNPA
jgi:hypothetical protein